MFRLCVVLFAVMCAEAGVTVGKAFFCRDPDTGKLHPANTTWPSTTFCGNYHCRLRKKNLTKSEDPPLRQINITNVDISTEIPKQKDVVSVVDKKLNLKKEAIDVIGINNLMRLDISNITREEAVSEGAPKASEDDRYLTEKEIATISAILHSVKKSDLDAIIEIYNLAQDIYKEVDKTSPENLIHETVNDIKQDLVVEKKSKLIKSDNADQVSYWYEPISNGKIRVPSESPDMASLHSTPMKVTTPKPAAPETTTPVYATKSIDSFFDRTLTSKDFGKLPYYYPISNFQRSSSYVHKPPEQKTHAPPTKAPKARVTEPSKYRKNIKPSVYLPYPFSFIPRYYNWTYPHTIYYNKNYLEREEVKKDKNKVPIKNAVLINPDLENDQVLFKAGELKADEEKEEKRLLRLIPENKEKQTEKFKHEWQTAPISKHILDDARAHIDKTKFLKPFTLRKKIKLERVGKVFKLDELTKRSKRNAELEPDLYEAYIERTTCKSDDTVPGFFRYGNITQPFPECCPQRIL